MVFGSKLRIRRNASKASYLPRKSYERNNVDPDQGRYRSTPGDSTPVNHSLYSVEILPNKTNLPDVLPLTAKYQTDNELYLEDFVTNSQFYSAYNKQTAVPQSAPVLPSKTMNGFFQKFSPFNDPYKGLNPAYNNRQSFSHLHQTHFVETCTQPYTKEALHNLTHPPPPYVAEIEREVIQHLEFMPSPNNSMRAHDSNENQFSNVLCSSDLNQDNISVLNRNDTRLPSYAEIQNQLENLTIASSTPSEKSIDETNSTTFTHNFSEPQTPEKNYTMYNDETITNLRQSMVMVETASQTDNVTVDETKTPDKKVLSNSNRLSLEEIDCEKLSQDLVSQLSPSDKLHQLLVPPKTYRSTSDFISDLYNINVISTRLPKREDNQLPADPIRSEKDSTIEAKSTTSSTQTECDEKSLPPFMDKSDSYYSRIAAASRSSLNTHYNREMTLANGDTSALTKKKEELIERLGKKLDVLMIEQTTLLEESVANDVLGEEVAQKVSNKVKSSQISRYRSYVDDVGYITKLLLSLSCRLAKTHNSLQNLEDNLPEKKSLEMKRDRLITQLEEAKQLKESIDKRGVVISQTLEKTLTIEEYADYDYFINMKVKLLVDSTEIANKILLGKQQLSALAETLVHSEC